MTAKLHSSWWTQHSLGEKIKWLLKVALGVISVAAVIITAVELYNFNHAKANAVAEARSKLTINKEVPVYGVPVYDDALPLFLVEQSPYEGPVEGKLIFLLPKRAENYKLDVLGYHTCRVSVSYTLNNKFTTRIIEGCPSLREGIETKVTGFEIELFIDGHWWAGPEQYSVRQDFFGYLLQKLSRSD